MILLFQSMHVHSNTTVILDIIFLLFFVFSISLCEFLFNQLIARSGKLFLEFVSPAGKFVAFWVEFNRVECFSIGAGRGGQGFDCRGR